jgi:hypothetical protein
VLAVLLAALGGTGRAAVWGRSMGEGLSADGTNPNAAVVEVQIEGTPRNLHPIL